MKPERLVGEIVEGRYALLEVLGTLQGGIRVLAYDMKTLRQTVISVEQTGSGVIQVAPISASPPPPMPQPLPGRLPAPPPAVPMTAAPSNPPATRTGRAVDTTASGTQSHVLEAAWFAQGEAMHQEEAAAEVVCHVTRQLALEQLASELSHETYCRYTLEPTTRGPGCPPPIPRAAPRPSTSELDPFSLLGLRSAALG